MDRETIINKLRKIGRHDIVIFGDIILDHYQWGEVTRISPEAPVPVVCVEKETYRLGGAANVARNIKSIGAEPYLVGMIGEDSNGELIRMLLKQEQISGSIFSSSNRKTTLKTRVMGNTQQIVRIDTESSFTLTDGEYQNIAKIYSSAPPSRFVIVSDYGKGLINYRTLDMLRDRKTIIDPKIKNFHRYKGVHLMTPNKKEAQEGNGEIIENKKDIVLAGRKIMTKHTSDNLLITMGPEGMVLFKRNKEILHITTSARKVYDVTGAGDTVIGVLGACLEAGIDLESGCVLANFAAGIVVEQIGSATANTAEVETAILKNGIPEINRWE